jgi:hypothetical protein
MEALRTHVASLCAVFLNPAPSNEELQAAHTGLAQLADQPGEMIGRLLLVMSFAR